MSGNHLQNDRHVAYDYKKCAFRLGLAGSNDVRTYVVRNISPRTTLLLHIADLILFFFSNLNDE